MDADVAATIAPVKDTGWICGPSRHGAGGLDGPRRIVALKLIKPGFASPELRWRFHQESTASSRHRPDL